ncbi:MAG: hypothetical protein ACRDMZ_12035 [Solirubrobacteraceae bacterium]
MSYNQFNLVEIDDGETVLQISGTTSGDLETLERIDVAVSALPADGGFPDLLTACRFSVAQQPATLKDIWTADYVMATAHEFTHHQRVVVLGRARYASGIDVWAETVKITHTGEKLSDDRP